MLEETLQETLRGGGAVMVPLFLCCAVMWYCLSYRFFSLTRGTRLSPTQVVQRTLAKEVVPGVLGRIAASAVDTLLATRTARREALDACVLEAELTFSRYQGALQAAVVVAPLLGLLGTVIGMINTFDSLQEMALFTQTGGIAAGISTALFSTQLGLLVAVPGLIGSQVLARRQGRLSAEVRQMKDFLCRYFELED